MARRRKLAKKNPGRGSNANVPTDPKPAEIAEEFESGDIIRLKASVVTNDEVKMAPIDLFRIGHPNEFLVVAAFDGGKFGPCVTLRQCCFLFENHSTGITTCKGHPAIYFEKMRKDRAKQKGDRLASVKIPWVGEVAGFEYEEDEENPKAKFRIMGKECELEGAPAKFFKSMVEGYGFKL
jgi:hypothetical protein